MAFEIKKISKIFNGKKVLHDLSFKFSEHKIHGLCGKNGSGKTTLLKIISGIIVQNEGEITFSSGDTCKDVAYIDNNPRAFFLRLSFLDNLFYFSALNFVRKKEVKKLIEEEFEHFNVSEFMNKPVNELSLGQIQLLNLARAYIPKPKIILYDEVFSSLDANNQNALIDFINRISEKKIATQIICSHNPIIIKKLAENTLDL